MASRLASNALISVLNVVLSGLVLFLMYRYFLAELGPSRLGIWALVVASISPARLAELGLAAGCTRQVALYKARGEDAKAAQVVQTTLVTLAVSAGAVAVLAYPLLSRALAALLGGANLGEAIACLPWVLTSFAIGILGGVAQSALDGCQRYVARVSSSLAGQLVFASLSLLLVPHVGLLGIAQAQVCQSVVTLLFAWVLLRRDMPDLPLLACRWSRRTFREMLGYSMVFQLDGLLVVLVDPLIKAALTHYGSLSATAYFEMANQLVQRLRQLLVAAVQVLTPASARAQVAGPGEVLRLYTSAYDALFFVAVPYFSLTVALMPAVGWFWIGREEPLFTQMAQAIAAGLAINTLSTPAYFSNIGTGHLWNNTAGLAVYLVGTALLGVLGARIFGVTGIAFGYAVSMALGGLLVQWRFLSGSGQSLRTALPVDSRSLAVCCLLALAGCLVTDPLLHALLERQSVGPLASTILRVLYCLSVFSACCLRSIWVNKNMVSLLRAIRLGSPRNLQRV